MLTLLLDTSTECGFVAIVERMQIHYHVQLPFGMQNAQLLLPEIQKGLQVSGRSLRDFHCVGAGIGPGSYTGMRVGAMVAKTLAFTCGLPLVGVCSLDSFVPKEDGAFAAVIDAKVGGVYLQTGVFSRGVVSDLSGPFIYSTEVAIEILRKVPVLVTPNAAQLRPKLEKGGQNVWQWEEAYPSAEVMASIVQQKFDKQEFSLGGHLDLLYLRKTQAEIEKAQKE